MYFLEIMEEHARRFPDRCAVCLNHQEQTMTYRMLWEYSGRLYAWLKKKQIGTESMVLLYMPKDPKLYVYVLGVMRAGAAFTIVENTTPKARRDFIRKDSEAQIVLTADMFDEIMEEQALDGSEIINPHDAAFAVYTSGTTGNPKGVIQEYGNVDLEVRYHQSHATGQGERHVSVFPAGFVVFVMEFVLELTRGNTVYIVEPGIYQNLTRFGEFLEEERIESVWMTPSMLRHLQSLGKTVKKAMVIAEPANGLSVDNVEITNLYAQSETCFTIARTVLDKKYDKAPVGKNYVGIELKILDEDGKQLGKNTVGEVCFRNDYFRGYIHLKNQTEYAFRNGVYHTGDLGYINEDGDLVISGRKDDMIKINGNRIEPAEIEAAGRRILGVDRLAAKGFIEEEGRSFVALYYVRNEGMKKLSDKDKAECIRKFSDILPKYMVPAYLIEIDKIPTVPNGKTDRKALPKPDTEAYRADYEAPADEFEKQLCLTVEQVLGIEKVGRKDDFYALGGDSLTGIEVVTRMDLPAFSTTDLFRGRVIEKISELYHRKQDEVTDWAAANEEAKKKEYPLTFEMKRFFDLQLFRPKSTMSVNSFFVRFPLKTIDVERFRKAVNTVIRHFSDFGTVITFNEDCDLVLKYDPSKIREASYYDIRESELAGVLQEKDRCFKMIDESFFDLSLIRTETYLYFLNRNHHIVFDGTCNLLLSEAITAAYQERPLRPDTYFLYLDRYWKRHTSEYEEELEHYFSETFTGKNYQRYLKPDTVVKMPGLQNLRPNVFSFSVEELKKAAKRLGGTPGLVTFAAVMLAFAVCSGEKDLIGLMQYDNRDDLLSSNTFGLLARSLPVAVEFEKLPTVHDLIEDLKFKITQGMAYDCMEKLIGKDTPFEPECLTFVYEGVLTGAGDFAQLGGETVFTQPPQDAPRDFAVLFAENGNSLMSFTGFREQYYRKERIQEYQDVYSAILCELVNEENAGQLSLRRYLDRDDCLKESF